MTIDPTARTLSVFLALATSGACLGRPVATLSPNDVVQVASGPDGSPEARPQGIVLDPGFVHASTVSRESPGIITRQIIQGPTGDLWLTTFSGVVRYNGEVFTNVTNIAPLHPVRAFSLLRDEANNIWLGTLGAGVYKYDGRSYTNVTTWDGLPSDRVLSMMQDSATNIWFGSEGAGAARYDGAAFVTFDKSDGFTDGDVSSMAQDGTGRIWFGTREGLFHYDGDTFLNVSETFGLTTGSYIPTLVDKRGHLWFGGADGLHHYDGVTLQQVMTEPSWALMEEDVEGNIWFSGESTLNRINPQTVGAETGPEVIRAAAVEGLIFDIFEDKDGEIWIGTLRGLGRLEGDAIWYYASHGP